MKTKTMLTCLITPSLALALGVITMASRATATPYATCLTNNAGIVSFRLNESADSVKVISSGGSVTNDIGPLSSGVTVTNLGISGVYRVVVQKTGTGAIETNGPSIAFNAPRGIAVNRNPASPYFGRVYIANATAGTKGDGIFIFDADLNDTFGQGATPRTGGITNFGTGGASSPYRLKVGADDSQLYICDWSDGSGNLYTTDPDVTTWGYALQQISGTAAIPVGAANNHGSVAAVETTGRIAGSDYKIYTIDEDYQTDPTQTFASEQNSLWQYDVGAGPLPWGSAPNTRLMSPIVNFVSATMDLARGANGYLYVSQYRSAGNETGVYVVDSAGNQVWDSKAASVLLGFTTDVLKATGSLAVSPDQKFLAAFNFENNVVTVVPIVSGIPNLAQRFQYTGFGTTPNSRGIAFDAADNLYCISSGLGIMRALSLGLSATATTGSDGTFTLSLPTRETYVSLVDASILYEASPGQVVTINIVRTNDDFSVALPVNFTMSGTATRGADYGLMTNGVVFTGNRVVIPAGSSNVIVSMVVSNDTVAELTETAVFNLSGGDYSVITPNLQAVDIVDDETPMADLAVVLPSMYERLTNDYVRLRIVRRGDTNAAQFAVNLTYTGTAAPGRYAAPTSVAIDPGVVNQNFDITPLNDNLLQGNQTIIANVASGTGYTVGTNSPTATATIVDDDGLPETVLWSENFNSESTSNNWTVRFGSANGIDDYRYQFSYDYASGAFPPAIPPAPHSSGDTRGCYLAVNKDEGSGLGAAGINIYPNGQSFSGNYAVRFDMYLMVGNAASTTEYALFGVNHSGNNTNWFRNSTTTFSGVSASGWSFDGLWYGVEADGAALGDYVIYSAPTTTGNNPTALTPGVNASTLTGIFKNPPYGPTLILPGAPGCDETSTTPSWSDVDIAHYNGVVTLKINNTVIMQYTNRTAFTNGNIMLGYCDAYDSIMVGNSCVIYDNLRVVAIGPSILAHPTNLVVTGGPGSAASFYVDASSLTGVTNFQWYRNGAAVSGATSATLNLTNLTAANYGTYNVVVSDGAYSLTSSNASLTPPAGPSIITPPASVVAVAGSPASFSVVAQSFTGTTNFQWMRGSPLANVSGANYSGITSRTLNIASVQSTNVGPYAVRINDGVNSLNVTSIVANLTIAKQPTITSLLSGSTLNLTFPTEIGPKYVLEWKGALTNGAWNQLNTNDGTGSLITVPESTLTEAQRFYRVRMQ